MRAHAAVLLGALPELPRRNEELLLKVQAEIPQAFSAPPADKTPPRRQSTSSSAEERARRQSQGSAGAEDRTPPARRQSQGSAGGSSEDKTRRLSGEARASGSAAGAAEAGKLQRRSSPPLPPPQLQLEPAATKPRAPSAKSPSTGDADDPEAAPRASPLPRVDSDGGSSGGGGGSASTAVVPADEATAPVEESAGEESAERAEQGYGSADDLR